MQRAIALLVALTAVGCSTEDPTTRQVRILVEQLGAADTIARMDAATALGRLGQRAQAAIGPLRKALGDSDPTVRAEAASALGLVDPSASTVEPLTAALDDEDQMVRFAAVQALAYLGSRAKSAVPALERLANDRDLSLRVTVRHALNQIQKPKGSNSAPIGAHSRPTAPGDGP